MSNLSTLIENTQAKLADYSNQLEELKKEANEDIDNLEEQYSQFADWLESKKDEVQAIIDEAKENETELDLVSDQVTGILDDIEETMRDWDFEYQDELENH